MYLIKDKYGNIIEKVINPIWVKQQKLVDSPILANSYEEADGVVLSDGETMRGIKGRNMENYIPLVFIEEVSGEPFIMNELNNLMINGQSQSDLNSETQSLLLDTMSGVAEMYELLSETQNLQLDTMSGIAEMYELAMSNAETEGSN